MSYQAYPPATYQAPQSTSYAYPPPPTYHNAPPQPPPIQQLGYPPAPPQYQSVEQFRAHYAGRLRELTFNSRPLIQELSVSAMNQRDAGNWDFMRVIVEEIEAATLRAHPDAKLPLLYLIDSISKNVGMPFTSQLLPPVLPRLYIYTYRQVNGTTRAKMEEMIALWRRSGPNRDDLYGPAVRHEVESAIFGSSGPAGGPAGIAGHPSQAQVVQMVNTRIQQKQAESNQKPWEERLRHEIGVLQQIAQLLATTQVSGPELQRISSDLGQTAPSPAPPPALSPAPPLANVHSPVPGYPAPPPVLAPSRPPPTNLPPFAPTLRHDAPSNHAPHQLSHLPTPTHTSSTPLQHSSTPIPAPTPVPAIPNIAAGIPANVADILRNLNTSGLLSNPCTPENAPAKLEKQKSGLASYEEMILALDVRLESLDLNKMSALPTNHLPQRCKQCGIRFTEGDTGMQAHMDWHFRRNRKERETEGRGAHRRWLPRAEEWVNDFGNAEAGPSTSSPGKSTAAANNATSLPAEKIAAYRKKWVRVPTDSHRASLPCPICKEVWKSEWSEEEEEWVWRNAIDVNGTIYHATCRAEQMFAKKVQKMLNPDGRRSNSKSPRITPQPNEVPTIKTEQVESGLKHEEREETPGSVGGGKRKAEEANGVENEVKRVKVEEDEVGGQERSETDGAGVNVEQAASMEVDEGSGRMGDVLGEVQQESSKSGDDVNAAVDPRTAGDGTQFQSLESELGNSGDGEQVADNVVESSTIDAQPSLASLNPAATTGTTIGETQESAETTTQAPAVTVDPSFSVTSPLDPAALGTTTAVTNHDNGAEVQDADDDDPDMALLYGPGE